MLPTDLGEAILRELQAIKCRLAELESATTQRDRTWLTPGEMSKLCGVSPRSLQTYVTLGRLSAASVKREPRGQGFTYRYHRELALRDLGI